MEQLQTSTPDAIKCRWDAYKASGKWYAGQEIDIPASLVGQSSTLVLEYIRQQQTQLVPVGFMDFHHVIRETDAQAADPNYKGFMSRLMLTPGLL
jgi:hypothetical protein